MARRPRWIAPCLVGFCACAPASNPPAVEPVPIATAPSPSAASVRSASVTASASASASAVGDVLSIGPPLAVSPRALFALPFEGASAFVSPAKGGGVWLTLDTGAMRHVDASGKAQARRAFATGNLFLTAAGNDAGDVVAVGGFVSLAIDGKALGPARPFDPGAHGFIRGAFVARRDPDGKLVFAHSLSGVPSGVLPLGASTVLWGSAGAADKIGDVTLEPGAYAAVLGPDGALTWSKRFDKPLEWAASLDGQQLLSAEPDRRGALELVVRDTAGASLSTLSLPLSSRVRLLAVTPDSISLVEPLRAQGKLDFGMGALPNERGFALLTRSLSRTLTPWQRSIHTDRKGSLSIHAHALSPTREGGLLLTGTIGGHDPLNAPFPDGTDADLFVVELDATGRQRWSVRRPLPAGCSLGPMQDNARTGPALVVDKDVYVVLSCPRVEASGSETFGANKGLLLAWERPR